MAKLNGEQITRELQSLSGWEFKDGAISKMFRFDEFMDGIHFINRVAPIAEAADHHPDIHVNYTRVTFVCSTHSEGGVTDKDLKLAHAIEETFAARKDG